MASIALLMGISDYAKLGALSACQFDAERMRDLLVATQKYDDVLCITAGTTADKLKDEIRAFFKKHQGKGSLDEAFLFFSGHGTYRDDALFCCTDFDPDKPNSTAISNSELDDLLRSVEPATAVKVIDACHSGSSYIKDAEESFEKALESKRSTFRSFLCMASSRQDQKSYALKHESKFTAQWIAAALKKESGIVLYRDIKAALADAFSADAKQNPYFVEQGSGLEVFTEVTEEMRKPSSSKTETALPTQGQQTVDDRLVTAIKALGSAKVGQADAVAAVEAAKAALDAEKLSDAIVGSAYQKAVSYGRRLGDLPRSRQLAEFARQNGWDKKYFLEIQGDWDFEYVPRNALFGGLAALQSNTDGDFTRKRVYVYNSISSTEKLPFEVAEIQLTPEDGVALDAFVIYIGIVHSKAEVVLLSAVTKLVDKGWDKRVPDTSKITWKNETHSWQEIAKSPNLIWEGPFIEGLVAVRTYLETLFPNPNEAQVRKIV